MEHKEHKVVFTLERDGAVHVGIYHGDDQQGGAYLETGAVVPVEIRSDWGVSQHYLDTAMGLVYSPK